MLNKVTLEALTLGAKQGNVFITVISLLLFNMVLEVLNAVKQETRKEPCKLERKKQKL